MRETAVTLIKNQRHSGIHGAERYGYSYVRKEAVKVLTDEKVLAQVAMGEHVNRIRKLAMSKLSDKQELARVATESRYADVHSDAVEKGLPEDAEATAAQSDLDPSIRIAA